MLDVRLVLFIAKKTKDTEGVVYPSVDAILKLFVDDVSAATNMQVTWPGSQSVTSAPALQATSNQHVESVSEMKSLSFQAAKAGFIKNSFVCCKVATDPAVWRIDHIDDAMCTMAKLQDGKPVGTQVVALNDLLATWKVHKGKVTELLRDFVPGDPKHTPLTSQQWLFDIAKGA